MYALMGSSLKHLSRGRNMKKLVKKNRDGTILFRSQKDLNQYIKEKVKSYNTTNFELAVLLSLDALHLEFGFGDMRLVRFLNHINDNVDSLANDWVAYSDLQKEYEHLFTIGGDNGHV